MTTKKDDQPRLRPLRFSLNQYGIETRSVKQTNEYLLTRYEGQLREKERDLEETKEELAKKELRLQLSIQELTQLKETSILRFGLGVLSLVQFGFGINLATSTPSNVAAWILISSAIVTQSVSFLMTYLVRSRKSN